MLGAPELDAGLQVGSHESGEASREAALLLFFPQGGSAQSRERRKNVRTVVAHLPSAADLPLATSERGAAPLRWPPGRDGPDHGPAGGPR